MREETKKSSSIREEKQDDQEQKKSAGIDAGGKHSIDRQILRSERQKLQLNRGESNAEDAHGGSPLEWGIAIKL